MTRFFAAKSAEEKAKPRTSDGQGNHDAARATNQEVMASSSYGMRVTLLPILPLKSFPLKEHALLPTGTWFLRHSARPPARSTIVREDLPGDHYATVVWLHGLGDSPGG